MRHKSLRSAKHDRSSPPASYGYVRRQRQNVPQTDKDPRSLCGVTVLSPIVKISEPCIRGMCVLRSRFSKALRQRMRPEQPMQDWQACLPACLLPALPDLSPYIMYYV